VTAKNERGLNFVSPITLHTLCDLQCGGELRGRQELKRKEKSNQIVTIRDESLLKGEGSKVGRKGGIWLVTHSQGIDSQLLLLSSPPHPAPTLSPILSSPPFSHVF
jgi:hypothetical protein